ncbi:MAG: methyltransferase domain-containing protein [Patescibacteria group bacterium]|nr:methyltransferase domain-containing protein [Patescibacteria group bacterium]
MGDVRPWDVADGDAQCLRGIPDHEFDFVHLSNCLEHLDDPREAVRNRLRVLKPGGFLIVTVPDKYLYKAGHWPSRCDRDPLWSFTIHRAAPRHHRSLNVVDLLRDFGAGLECELLRLVRDFYVEGEADRDQTLGPSAPGARSP